MKVLVIGICFGLLIGVVSILQSAPLKGDMNGDRILDIKDLSILAAVINEQG